MTRGRAVRGALHPRCDHAFQDGAIDLAHDPRRLHRPARAERHDRVGLDEMGACALDQLRAGLAQIGAAQRGDGIAGVDAGLVERLARQIEPADAGVLVEVAQDVGQLQGAAEMVRQAACRRRAATPNARTDSRPTALATRSQ